ncbi:MAG: hypothetical protein AAF688_10665, partial [Bacteroidota bacterium]
VIYILLLVLLSCNSVEEKEVVSAVEIGNETSNTKTFVFYFLVFIDVAFLAFILLTRYLTRNNEHPEDDEH